jgi:hypothetical protein
VPTATYAGQILADQPIAYWRLGDGGSATADASGHGHAASLVGDVMTGAPGALASEADPAMTFDGESGYLDEGTPISVGDDFTIEAWVKASSSNAGGPIVSVGTGSGSTPAGARALYLESGRFRGMADLSSQWPSYMVQAGPVDVTAWHFVVFTTHGGTELKLYVDGALVASSSVPRTPGFNGAVRVAWSSAEWLPKFGGFVDEVALYDHALSPERVQAHFNGGKLGQQAGCPNLQSIVDAAPSGSVVTVPPCVYRETVAINKPLIVDGQGKAEIRGSDLWSDWTRHGDTWISGQAIPPLPAFNEPGRCQPGTQNRCLLPEQVFFDGKPLYPVGTQAAPSAGQFALDADRHVILADDPAGHAVEVSTRSRWIITATDNVTIRGFTMRHAANDALSGAISNDGHSAWVLQDSVLSDAHGSDVSIRQGTNVEVLRNDISRAGNLGIHGDLVTQSLVQGNQIHSNNTDQFNVGWGAGGLKVTRVQGFVQDGNDVHDNTGPGLWCDVHCQDVTYSNNRVHHNSTTGIFFEISIGAKIDNNVVWENGWGSGNGIEVASSANTEVSNNTLAWNADGIVVTEETRDDAPAVMSSVHVQGNAVVGSGDALGLAWQSDSGRLFGDPSVGGAHNSYWFPTTDDSQSHFDWNGRMGLEEFNKTPGEHEGQYLADAEKDRILAANAVPVAIPNP